MLKIGEFSKLSRVSIRMLRHYDEIGLLKPSSIDRFTGYRYYSEDQLPVVGRITALKDMGFSLSVITDILSDYGDSLIGEVNAAVAQWIVDNGYEYDAPSFNIYHVSPHETSDPEEFVTEVCYPVRKK